MNKNIRRHVNLKLSKSEITKRIARATIAHLLHRQQSIMKAITLSSICMPEEHREIAMRLSSRVMMHNQKLRASGTELWTLKSIKNMRTWS